MSEDLAVSMVSGMVWMAVKVTAPLLIAIMLVGLLISIFQVDTQVQEMTLAFVPKLFVAAMGMIVLGAWMTETIVAYATGLFEAIPGLVK